jgi:hypothetical protein
MRVRARRFLRWATLLSSREQMVVFVRGAFVQIKMQRPQEQTLDQEARDQTGKICANQILTFAVGNNVRVKDRENIFRINGLCLWCARRAEKMFVISMACRDGRKSEVHFPPIGAFQTEHQS